MRSKFRLLIAAFVVVVGALFITTSLASANQGFLPSGINSVSASKAKSQVLDYAQLNDEYAELLSKQTGATSFNRADYRSRGFSKAKSNTLNTSLTSGGTIAKTTGATGTKTLVLVNIKTGKKVEVMVRCANIRAKKGGKCDCKPVTVRKVAKILVNKKFTKTVTKTCPSGQTVTVTVNGRVRGWIRGTVTAKVIGSAKIYLNQQVNLQVTAQISVKCGEIPPPTCANCQNPPPVADVCPNIPGAQATPPTGMVIDETGNCVRPKVYATASAKATASASVTCPDGTTVEAYGYGVGWAEAWADTKTEAQSAAEAKAKALAQAGADADAKVKVKCGSTPPPPAQKCPDGRPVPKDGCDRPPVVNIMGGAAHTYVGGNVAIWIETSDPDGDAQTLEVVGDSFAHISGVIPSSVRWDGTACPSGKQCWRATLWGDKVGTAKVVASVTAGGKTVVSQPAYVPIKPDDFG